MLWTIESAENESMAILNRIGVHPLAVLASDITTVRGRRRITVDLVSDWPNQIHPLEFSPRSRDLFKAFSSVYPDAIRIHPHDDPSYDTNDISGCLVAYSDCYVEVRYDLTNKMRIAIEELGEVVGEY